MATQFPPPSDSSDDDSKVSDPSSPLSTTEDDDEPGPFDLGPVDDVDFNWLLADEVVAAMTSEGQDLPRRETPPPAPAAAGLPLPKQIDDGDFKYVEFIPFWTDPDWEEDRTLTIPKQPPKRGQRPRAATPTAAASGAAPRAAPNPKPSVAPVSTTGYRSNPLDQDSDDEEAQLRPLPVAKEGDPRDDSNRRFRKGDTGRHMRPALLGRDAHKNPTPYALRFGMHPRGPSGRSRLSPTTSQTRRVRLSRPQMTATGFKDYVDIEDAKLEEKKYMEKALNLGHGGLSFRDYLYSLYASRTNQGTEMYRAICELRRIMDSDEDFQRYMLLGSTTDERVEHRVHSVEDDFGLSTDLNGPLHDLLERDRWEDTSARGIDPREPRFMYNLLGRRGEYSAQNEEVWAAIQPALQLATHVLNSNHPFWLALLNVYCRREIDRSRDKKSFVQRFSKSSLASLWPDDTQPGMLFEARVLRDSGFDSAKAISGFLSDRLQITIGSAQRDEGKSLAEDEVHWGRTCVLHENDSAIATIMLELTAESIWPLLVPFFTAAEKAAASFLLATTLLHELAHAVNYAMAVGFKKAKSNHLKVKQLSWLKPHQAVYLETVWEGLCRTYDGPEAYWRDEPVAELGFAFENQLFGLVTDAGLSSTFRNFANPIVIAASRWPTPNILPHVITNRNILREPHLPTDAYKMALSVADTQRLFKSDFWHNHCVKYGHQGLKFDQAKPTITRRQYYRQKDLKRQFGKGAAEWMTLALGRLNNAGEKVFKNYLEEATIDALGCVVIRKRWHYFAKCWHHRSTSFIALGARVTAEEKVLAEFIKQAMSTDEDKAGAIALHNTIVQTAINAGQRPPAPGFMDLQTYVAGLKKDLESSFDRLVALYLESQHYSLVYVKDCQHLAIEYMKQTHPDRQLLYDRYGRYIYWQLENYYQETLQACLENLEAIGNAMAAFIPTDEGRTHLTNVINEVQAKVQMTDNLAEDVKEYFSLHSTVQDVDLEGAFPTVPTGGYKSMRASMESVFLEELNHVSGPIREVVIKYLELLNEHKKVRRGYETPLEKAMENRLQTHIANSSVGRKEKVERNPAEMFGGLSRDAKPSSETAMGLTPNEKFFQPPAPALPQHLVPGLQFGAPSTLRGYSGMPGSSTPINSVAGHPGFVRTQDPQTGFTQYASTQSPFNTVQGASWMDTAQPQNFSKAAPLGSAPPLYQIFGTPTSVFNNVTEDLRRAGANPGELQNLFGGDAYLRQKLNEQDKQIP